MHKVGEGFPDLVVSRREWGTFLVEVKVPKKKPNQRQLEFYEEWSNNGGEEVLVVDSADKFFEIVGFKI